MSKWTIFWAIVFVLLVSVALIDASKIPGYLKEPESERTFDLGDYDVGEIVIGQWGPSAECVEGYGVLHIQLQPELQKQLESAFGWGDASPGKITIYCGRLVGTGGIEDGCWECMEDLWCCATDTDASEEENP